MGKKKDLTGGINSLIQDTTYKGSGTTEPTENEKLVKTSVQLPEQKLRQFKAALGSAGVTMRDVFLKAIDDFIEEQKRELN